jgi:hypothetical protein
MLVTNFSFVMSDSYQVVVRGRMYATTPYESRFSSAQHMRYGCLVFHVCSLGVDCSGNETICVFKHGIVNIVSLSQTRLL